MAIRRSSAPEGSAFEAVHALRPLAGILMGAALFRTFADPDLWGHVRFGLDILEAGGVPRRDPYSFTSDLAWINHEWLSELAMATAYTLAGAPGLLLLKAGLCGLTLFGLDRLVRDRAEVWRFGALAVASAALLPLTVTLRPQLWTVLLVVVLGRLFHAGAFRLWLVPFVFAVWANVHGGWILGLGILSAWTVAMVWSRELTMHGAAALLLSSCLATLLTPYGGELWHFVGSTVRLSRSDIAEWQPIWRARPDALISWAAGAVLMVIAVVKWRSRAVSALPAVIVLAIASMLVNRLVPLFVLTLVISFVPLLPARRPSETSDRRRDLVDAAAVCLGLALVLPPRALSCMPVPAGPHTPDRATMSALVSARPAGRLVTFFDWGQAALFHLGPRLKVSVDGRRETIYSADVLAAQYAIAAGDAVGLAALARAMPEYVWLPLPHSQAVLTSLAGHGYRIDRQGPKHFLAVRADLPRVAVAASPEMPRCFPGL